MNRSLVIALGLAAFVALCFFSVRNRAPAIEADLTLRSSEALAGNSFAWASVTADGRDLTLHGVAPTGSDRARAVALVADVWGVRKVYDRTGLADAAATAEAPTPETAEPGAAESEPLEPAASSCRQRLDDLLAGRSVRFDIGKSEVPAESYGLLDRLADLAGACPSVGFRIVGHASSTGGAERNQQISEARADAVRAYLIGKGMAEARLSTVGYGQTRPAASNATAAGRAENRRVEITVREN